MCSSDLGRMINVSQIKKGIVIDHVEAGHGFHIYKALHLDALSDPVVLLTNIPSKKMGVKDMIKIETDFELNMDVLGLIDPYVTINFVRDVYPICFGRIVIDMGKKRFWAWQIRHHSALSRLRLTFSL